MSQRRGDGVCGRYSLTSDSETLAREFDIPLPAVRRLRPRYNIAPSQPVLAMVRESGGLRPDILNWGFLPAWAREPDPAMAMINARSETVAEKPMFRNAFRNSRCLIPADGFYEWKKEGRERIPYYIRLRDSGPFAFAGIWSCWQGKNGSEIRSCAILTTVPNSLMKPIHQRMPVMLDKAGRERWMMPGLLRTGDLQVLFTPYPESSMTACRVSTRVNSPRNDDALCLVPEVSVN